jgi:hypothetical protein
LSGEKLVSLINTGKVEEICGMDIEWDTGDVVYCQLAAAVLSYVDALGDDLDLLVLVAEHIEAEVDG